MSYSIELLEKQLKEVNEAIDSFKDWEKSWYRESYNIHISRKEDLEVSISILKEYSN